MDELQAETAIETASRTRPVRAVRRVAHTRGTKKVTRYTLDLDGQQHMFLRMFAIQNEVEASKVMRTMLYFLESDQDLANRVLDEIFGTEGNLDDDSDDDSDTENDGDAGDTAEDDAAVTAGATLSAVI